MTEQEFTLRDDSRLVIREGDPCDAAAILAYLEEISGQSDFLTFGPGEFDLTEEEEQEFLRVAREAENQLYLVGIVNGSIVSTLSFAAGRRPRVRHVGEFGISVHQAWWSLGFGSRMLDTLIDWARCSDVIAKINLRVRTDNRRAIQLYERKGFAREGVIRKACYVNGDYRDDYWMGLEL